MKRNSENRDTNNGEHNTEIMLFGSVFKIYEHIFLWFKVEDDNKDDKCVHRFSRVFLFLNKKYFLEKRLSYVVYQFIKFLLKKMEKSTYVCIF